jgi:sarcosine dehydrogenase
MMGQMDTDLEFVQYTKQLVTETLPKETGDWAGWEEQGGIFPCSSKDRLIAHNRVGLLARAMFNVEVHDLSPAEAKQVHPLMRVDDLYGCVHLPGDGTIDPTAIVRAYTKCAKQMGAKVFENARVTGIHQQNGHVTGISTTAGDIRTSAVINCAGAWARKLTAMAGVDIPLVAFKHAYVVTEPIKDLAGLPSIRDYNKAVYMKVAGDAFHLGGYEQNPIRIRSSDGFDMDDDFEFGLYDLDWDVFECHLEAHINRVPVIAEAGIQSTVCGPESFTPDHRPLMGEVPSLRGFYIGCGLNSAGILYSGGFGRELASWVATGRPKADVFGMDVKRFHPDCTRQSSWVVERSHETYANQSIIPFSHDQSLGGRNIRCSSFHDDLVGAGCVMVESHGFERPGWFEIQHGAHIAVKPYDYHGAYGFAVHDNYVYKEELAKVCNFDIHTTWEAEHHACRERVAIFDTSAFGKLVIAGVDAAPAMEWLCSNVVTKSPGATTYTTLCNSEGTVEADLTVSAVENNSFYVCTAGATATHDTAWIKRVIEDCGYGATVTDVSDYFGVLSVQGPLSRTLLQEIVDVDLSDSAFPFSTHQLLSVAGHTGIRAIRVTFVGELGWELHIPRSDCSDVYKAIMAAGAKHGLRNAGLFATHSLSLEKGFRHWNADLRCTDTPMAAGLGFTCKFKTDVPFLGRDALDAVKRLPCEGLSGRVACFTTGHGQLGETRVPLHGMEPLYRDGEYAGFLRTAGFGFSVDASIGYAWVVHPGARAVTIDYLKSGSYEIETYEHGRVTAQFHAKAPFDPMGRRVRGHY